MKGFLCYNKNMNRKITKLSYLIFIFLLISSFLLGITIFCLKKIYDFYILQKQIIPLMEKAKSWLDQREYDPQIIRDYGLKGKKKTVELLEAYLAIYDFVSLESKKEIEKKLNAIYALTLQPRFHDMQIIPDNQFHEDATSYLRLCYLLETKGFDTSYYRQRIKEVLPRYNGHLWKRGINQKMIFSRYYAYFGFAEPFDLMQSYKNGIIAQKIPPEYLSLVDVYSFTHEIFAAAGLEKSKAFEFFSKDDILYLRKAIKKLTILYLRKKNLDAVSELAICMALLEWPKNRFLFQVARYIIKSQNADGSFGNYEENRKVYGKFTDEGFYLHTTMVSLKALSLLFDPSNFKI